MLYKRLIINGKEYLLAVSQAGSGAPAATDPGSPGILYMDTDTGDLYKCSGGEDGAWAWKKLSEGGSDYKLPIGGEQLGGVKNGGNVVINADGTMTAPEAGSIKITGTENSKIAPTGTILDNGTEIHLVSQEIRVNPGEQYLLTCSANFGNSLYAIYDSNGVMKENLTAPATKEGRNEVDLQVTIPSDGAILRVAWNKDVTDTPYAVTKVGNAVVIPKSLDGVTVAVIGDSLVERNNSAKVNFVDLIAAETGATVTNLGVGGTGYMAGADESKAFYQRAAQIPEGTDRVLIYGSGNDRNMPLGNPTDTGTDTLCGCINATIDAVYERVPTAWVGIIAPAPWKEYPPYGEKKQFELMVQAQQRICARRGIPFLDLYHASGLRPWDDTFRELAFDEYGVHPNDTGHALIAPQIQAFLLGAIGGGAVASVPDSSQNAALTTAQINALDGMFKVCAFTKADISAEYSAFKTAFGITDSGGEEEPDEPATPEVTLTSISATYSGGDVAVGTAVSALTGIVVKAHYSDGTSKTVTGYTLSGTIAEGSNVVTVTYKGKTTTFNVTGIAENDTEEKLLLSNTSAPANQAFNMEWNGNPVVPAVMMADFDETNHKTALSGKTISRIAVKVHTAGTVTIGKCDISNIYTGAAPQMIEPQVYTATAGMNTFAVNISLGDTETLAFHAVTDTGKLAYDSSNTKQMDMSVITCDQYVGGFVNWTQLNGEIYGYE